MKRITLLRRNESGMSFVFVGFSMMAFISASMLAIDVGMVMTARNQAQNAADDASVRMAAGEPVDLHEVMLARETASLQFQLAVQVRNKLVAAYQDVMRMPI